MPDPIAAAAAPPEFLSRPGGGTIAYRRTPGKTPGIVFLTGFKSDMTGAKALALEEMARAQNRAFLRFDYTGHGASSGRFEDGAIGDWADDATLVLDRLTEGPQVLVGSSMGGWIMLLVALRRPRRIAGLVGVAAAPDFTEDLLPRALDAAQKEEIARTGRTQVPNCYGEEPYVITRRLIEEGRYHLLLRGPIAIEAPVRLIHGVEDRDVPWQTGTRLSERLTSPNVELTLVKGGGHRLSEPADLDRLCATVTRLIEELQKA